MIGAMLLDDASAIIFRFRLYIQTDSNSMHAITEMQFWSAIWLNSARPTSVAGGGVR